MILRKIASRDRLETIDMGGGESFNVTVRRPDWRDELADHGEVSYGFITNEIARAQANSAERRIQTTIVGWDGVVDEAGHAVAFSFDALVVLCEQSPLLFYRLLKLANSAYAGVEETERKNSSAPPSTSSTETAQAEPTTAS